jgi:hypothetical protein
MPIITIRVWKRFRLEDAKEALKPYLQKKEMAEFY